MSDSEGVEQLVWVSEKIQKAKDIHNLAAVVSGSPCLGLGSNPLLPPRLSPLIHHILFLLMLLGGQGELFVPTT